MKKPNTGEKCKCKCHDIELSTYHGKNTPPCCGEEDTKYFKHDKNWLNNTLDALEKETKPSQQSCGNCKNPAPNKWIAIDMKGNCAECGAELEGKKLFPPQQEKVLYICPIHGRISKPCVHPQPTKSSECNHAEIPFDCIWCGKTIIGKSLLAQQKKELMEIVERYHYEEAGTYDYDGIAEGLLRYLKLI